MKSSLRSVIQSFRKPGPYRGSVHRENDRAVSYVLVDSESPVAQVNIDLVAWMTPSDDPASCVCGDSQNRFSVNPKD
jgi:hypothetical protein